jgi:hypothetical protein
MRKLFFLFGLMLSVSLAFAQQTISGRVTGEDGNPLVGATVAAKGAVYIECAGGCQNPGCFLCGNDYAGSCCLG